MPNGVFVSGASGFVGTAVVAELLSRGLSVTALVHRRPVTAAHPNLRTVSGDLFNPQSLRDAIHDCGTVVHLVGIIMERRSKGVTFERMHVQATQAVLEAAKSVGVRRWVHMSALGSRFDAVSDYHKTKYRAEQLVRDSGLDWTIFRPSLIHGPGGEFMAMEAQWARHKKMPFLFMPYFGSGLMGFGGAGKLQPVYVQDVARAFAQSLEKPQTIGEIYPLGGADQITWPEMHNICAQAIVGNKRLVIPMPVWAAKIQAAVGIGAIAGFNRDQVIMSQENNTCDDTKFKDAFGWMPVGFEAALGDYAKSLRSAAS